MYKEVITRNQIRIVTQHCIKTIQETISWNNGSCTKIRNQRLSARQQEVVNKLKGEGKEDLAEITK